MSTAMPAVTGPNERAEALKRFNEITHEIKRIISKPQPTPEDLELLKRLLRELEELRSKFHLRPPSDIYTIAHEVLLKGLRRDVPEPKPVPPIDAGKQPPGLRRAPIPV